MNYEDAVRYLLSLGREMRGVKFDLENIAALAEALGRPHRAYPSAHIAGTNGKGSVAAMLDSILRQVGLRVGLYTSPHLVRINERIRVAGEEIPDEEFALAFERVRETIERLMATGALRAHPTYFEFLTAMAFDVFARERVGFAVFEVGMGGRLDATNIVSPVVCVITQIDFDHEAYLGHSIEQIAGEKAGIVKAGVPVVCATGREEATRVIEARAARVGAPLIDVEREYQVSKASAEHGRYRFEVRARDGFAARWSLGLAGRFQVQNALLAAAAARLLAQQGVPVTDAHIAQGLACVRWPGRLERLEWPRAGEPESGEGEKADSSAAADSGQARPPVYLDGAHNPAGAREVAAFWREQLGRKKIHLVYGAMQDKAVEEIMELLLPLAATVTLTAPSQPRAASAEALAAMARHFNGRVFVEPQPLKALDRARALASPEDVVFVTGSLYLVGDIRRHWMEAGGLAQTEARRGGARRRTGNT